MTDSLSIAAHAFAIRVLMSISLDETLLPREVNESTSFRELPFKSGDVASLIKAHIFRLVCIEMEAYACSCSF